MSETIDYEKQEAALDEYDRMKELQDELELLTIKENFIKDEVRYLRRELIRAQDEVLTIQSVPLKVGNFVEMVDPNYAFIEGDQLVRVMRTIDRRLLKPNTSVALHRHAKSIVDILPPEGTTAVQILEDKPDVCYADIGGLDMQKQELREAVELPLTHAELYKQIGIDPPRGVLLYGPPGTGKTMLAKAVAHHTNASFIAVTAPEFVQKYLGEGPKMVRDTFALAREHAPSILFIDEIDSIAQKRFDAEHGSDREVQRVLMELLAQMDGFDQTTNVKVIMATNRPETLDPAILRPGRLDRKIEFPLPDRRQKRLILQVVTKNMSLSPDVDLEDYVSRPDKISGAEITAICMEAGMEAVRRNRYIILPKDFEKAYEKIVHKPDPVMSCYN
ncbi:26S protease regulatory subunit 6B like protein [Tritrichomonas foetus]|uniref:26S protease regulatory subunit 6B like protein n=1 Tax=Tritrichomonas foetus TaxID=1144522 RepID=A0A1J4JL20_9EUKA|nr:26S protease regulatory subunit 6B like protein [Tritrichomonas foetus]|eukprot:OHS99786.1 26S protease regulatory subunit 6B like protein [Tritrichomonas foetus]